jgi:hypothetical protein
MVKHTEVTFEPDNDHFGLHGWILALTHEGFQLIWHCHRKDYVSLSDHPIKFAFTFWFSVVKSVSPSLLKAICHDQNFC